MQMCHTLPMDSSYLTFLKKRKKNDQPGRVTNPVSATVSTN